MSPMSPVSRRHFLSTSAAMGTAGAASLLGIPLTSTQASAPSERTLAPAPARPAFVVPRLGLGTLVLGENDNTGDLRGLGCDEKDAFRILDTAVAAGVRYIDTADIYGHGFAERLLGKWMRQRKNRNAIVLASKFRFMTEENPGNGGSRQHIMSAIEHSLRRLSTDHLDLYHLHAQDLTTPEEETLRALQDLVQAGKICHFGASNYAAWRLSESVFTSAKLGIPPVTTLQAKYNLVRRGVEFEHLAICQRHGATLLCWAPLAEGFLTGKHARGAAPVPGTRLAAWAPQYARYATPRGWHVLQVVRGVAEDVNATPAQVSLAWLLTKPAVGCAIMGARSVAQIEDNVGAFNLVLPPDAVTALDAASQRTLEYPYSYLQRELGGWA
jgi:aryl-alcohol dehydrogenase-like predicted oxidoreductase